LLNLETAELAENCVAFLYC